MKVFAISGYTKSGKTTTGEALIKELSSRGYKVRSVKDIHAESFCMDTSGSNTSRLVKAGSDMVTARGLYETDFLVPRRMDIREIADMLDAAAFGADKSCDILLIEGAHDEKIPRILTAKTTDEIDERKDEYVFVISGVISGAIDSYNGIKCVNALTDIKELTNIVLDNAVDWGAEYNTVTAPEKHRKDKAFSGYGDYIKRFKSKRNTVILNRLNGEKYVTKSFTDRKNFFNEIFIHEILYSNNINVPKLLELSDTCVKYEYIEGPLLIDILEEGKPHKFEYMVKLLVKWLGDFYKTLLNSMGAAWVHNDLQLRNFILNEKDNEVYGIDFELCSPGDIEKDIAELFIFISAYEPQFCEIRLSQALCFLKEAVILGLNPELFFAYLPDLWEKIRKRRNLGAEAALPVHLLCEIKKVL